VRDALAGEKTPDIHQDRFEHMALGMVKLTK
jgi:hypothetical protein